MITQWFMTFLHGLAAGLFGWAHNALPSPPTWITDLTGAFSTVLGMVPDSIRYFVPLGPAVTAGLAFAGLVVAVGLIRIGRRVLSLVTGGGGNA
jgi:hypothetical protein